MNATETTTTYTATIESFDDRRPWERMVRKTGTIKIQATDEDEAIRRAQSEVAALNAQIPRGSERDHRSVAIELTQGDELIAICHADGHLG